MLDFWDILIIAVVVVVVLLALPTILSKIKSVNNIKAIGEKVKLLLPNSTVELFDRDEIYQLEIIQETSKILIKVVFSREDYEFIITNTNKWTINNNPFQWTRKSKPIFIENSDSFVEYKKDDLNISKIVLLYPSSKRIIRYLNESDTVVMKPEDKFKDITFIKYEDLEKILKNR